MQQATLAALRQAAVEVAPQQVAARPTKAGRQGTDATGLHLRGGIVPEKKGP